MRNHRYHGLFGMIIIEPPASRWYSFGGLGKGDYKEQAVITTPAKKAKAWITRIPEKKDIITVPSLSKTD